MLTAIADPYGQVVDFQATAGGRIEHIHVMGHGETPGLVLHQGLQLDIANFILT